ncbi:MAG TPA: hypothetical protein VN655_12135 [Pseudolabrys sp.]|nr:hypothetical protein [Pseudolabrys sp.]
MDSMIRANLEFEKISGGYWTGDYGIERPLAYFIGRYIHDQTNLMVTLEEHVPNVGPIDIAIWNTVQEDLECFIEVKKNISSGGIKESEEGLLTDARRLARTFSSGHFSPKRNCAARVRIPQFGFICLYFQKNGFPNFERIENDLDSLVELLAALPVQVLDKSLTVSSRKSFDAQWHIGALCLRLGASADSSS